MASITEGRLHRYWPQRNLTLFEYVPASAYAARTTAAPNTLIIIGGLYDGFLSIPYVSKVASYINLSPDWSVMEIQLSSSLVGWGTGDLHRDTDEIAHAVQYLRNCSQSTCPEGGKVVLMGHSTGSQNVLHYLYHQSQEPRPPVHGAILQAAVSDREYLAMMRELDPDVQQAYEKCVRIALDSTTGTHQDTVSMLAPDLASVFGFSRGLISYQRFLSLASPSSPEQPELDDLFSSDLSTETLSKTFGAVGTSPFVDKVKTKERQVLVLLSADDECYPETVNKEELFQRWKSALKAGGALMAGSSGIIAGASHNVKQPEAQLDLTDRILTYLESTIGGLSEETRDKLDQDKLALAKAAEGNT